MATPTSNSVPVTIVDPLALGFGRYVTYGTKWGGDLGEGVVLTYSFPGDTAYHTASYGSHPGHSEWTAYSSLSSGERAAVRTGLAVWASVADVSFVEVADNSTTVGELRFASTSSDVAGETAHAYFPSSYPSAGDVWFSVFDFNAKNAATISRGSFDFEAIIHELGHTLGLKHTFSSPNAAPHAHDNYFWSIMSYTAKPGGGDNFASFYPTTPMYYDLVAIQGLYGRNLNHNAGNTTYKFVDGRTYFQTIDDAGGHDRIAFVGSRDVTIDLRSAHFSTLSAPISFSDHSSTRATVAIGPNTVIEDALAGVGNDRIIGNSADNTLYGRSGNDVLWGGAGDDTLVGGSGHDAFYFSAALSATDNLDHVLDFQHGVDTFHLAHSVFTHIARGTLHAANFALGTAAHDASDRIVYDKAHGALYFDPDGSGAAAATEFATVKAGIALSALDFIIY